MKLIIFISVIFFLNSVSAQPLNALLMSVDDRNTLDNMRKQGVFKNNTNSTDSAVTRLDGVLLVKGKDAVVFISGENTLKSRFISDSLHVHTKNIPAVDTKIKVTKNKRTRYMKPGQIWLSSKKTIDEEYKVGAIK